MSRHRPCFTVQRFVFAVVALIALGVFACHVHDVFTRPNQTMVAPR